MMRKIMKNLVSLLCQMLLLASIYMYALAARTQDSKRLQTLEYQRKITEFTVG